MVVTRAAAERTAGTLRQEILSGVLAAGARLSEMELAQRYQVSRTPVREALSRLAAEGLVELVPNRGARVARWSDAEIEDIFTMRARLEPYAVRLAVPRLVDEDLDELEDLAVHMQARGRVGPRQDLDGVIELNRRFHFLLAERSGNVPVVNALRAVVHAAVVAHNFHDYTPEALARSLAHHIEIVAAARAGDPEWAEAVMVSHLHNARAAMLPPRRGEETP